MILQVTRDQCYCLELLLHCIEVAEQPLRVPARVSTIDFLIVIIWVLLVVWQRRCCFWLLSLVDRTRFNQSTYSKHGWNLLLLKHRFIFVRFLCFSNAARVLVDFEFLMLRYLRQRVEFGIQVAQLVSNTMSIACDYCEATPLMDKQILYKYPWMQSE